MNTNFSLFKSILAGSRSNVYVNSANIQAYPCSRRRSATTVVTSEVGGQVNTTDVYIPFDPEAKLTTEETSRHLTSVNGYKTSYIESITDKEMILTVDGYRFKIAFAEDPLPASYTGANADGFRAHSIACNILAAGAVDYSSLNVGDCLYANILLEERRVVDIQGFREYNTWIIRNQSYDGSETQAAASLDVILPTDDGQLQYGTKNPYAYYFTGLTFSTKPLTHIDQATVQHSSVPTRSERMYNAKILTTGNGELYIPRQRVVSLKLFEFTSSTDCPWAVHNYARLPEISHGEFDESVELGKLVANSDVISKASLRVQDYEQERVDRFVADKTGNVLVHNSIKVAETQDFDNASANCVIIKSTCGDDEAPGSDTSIKTPYIFIGKADGNRIEDNYNYATPKKIVLTDKFTETNFDDVNYTPPTGNTNSSKLTKSKLTIDRWDVQEPSKKVHYHSELSSSKLSFNRKNDTNGTENNTEVTALKTTTPEIETNKISVKRSGTADGELSVEGTATVTGQTQTGSLLVDTNATIPTLNSTTINTTDLTATNSISTKTLNVSEQADIETLTARTVGTNAKPVSNAHITALKGDTINSRIITNAETIKTDVLETTTTNSRIGNSTNKVPKIYAKTVYTTNLGSSTSDVTNAYIDTADINNADIETADITSATITTETVTNSTITEAIITAETVDTATITTATVSNLTVPAAGLATIHEQHTDSITGIEDSSNTTGGVKEIFAKNITVRNGGNLTYDSKPLLAVETKNQTVASSQSHDLAGKTLVRLVLSTTKSN